MTGLGNGANDTSEGAAGDGFLAPLVVQPGQGYYLLIDNWLDSSNGFNLTWGGSASNFLNCNANPDCPVEVEAGEDLLTCVNPDPIQLNGSAINTDGTVVYNWIGEDPAHTSFLNNPNAQAPVVNVPPGFVDTITYTLVVADNICTSFDQMTIIITDQLELDLEEPELFCTNNTYTLDAGPGYDTYLWSTGSTEPAIMVSDTGTYGVTVTSLGGCISVDEVVLTDPLSSPSPPNIVGDTTICIGSAVTLWAGGGYTTYNWNFGHTNPGAIVSEGGTYIVTVTNEIGCPAVDSIIIEQLEAVATPLNIGANREICYNEVLNLDAGDQFADYEWSDFSTGQVLSIDSAGLYCLTVTDVNGCKSSDCIVISEVTTPVLELEGYPFYCESGTTIGVADNFEQYWWSTGSNETSIYVSSPGLYSVTVENEGCQDTMQVNVVDNRAIPPTIDGPLFLCEGEPTYLSIIGDYDAYQWSDGTTGPNITINEIGNYSLTVTDPEGCQEITDFNIAESPLPVPPIIGETEICPGDTAILSSYGFDFYQWSTGEDNSFIGVSESGTYTLTVRDSMGCPGTSEVSIEVFDTPLVELTGGDFYCSGEFVVLGTTANYASYSWSDGTTGSTTNIATPGLHSVTVQDENGCHLEESIEIEVRELPEVSIVGPDIVCEGNSITLQAGGAFTAYSWSTGDTTSSAVVTEAGIYVLEATNEEGCSDKAVFAVQELPALVPSIMGDPEVCGGSEANLSVEPIFATYEWSNGATSHTATFNTPGMVYVTVTDGQGCSGVDSVEVSHGAFIQFTIEGNTPICEGESIVLEAGPGFSSYLWSNGATTNSLEIASPGNYSVTVTDAEGCIGTDEVTVQMNNLAVPQIEGILSFCEGGSTMLNVGTDLLIYQWSNGNTGQSIEVNTPGVYAVTVTDQYGCQKENAVEVVLELLPEINLAEKVDFCEGSSIEIDAGSTYPSYSWSNGASGQIVEFAEAGTYIVTGMNAQGCIKKDTIAVEMLPAPDFTINAHDQLTCTINSVELSVDGQSAIEDFSFQWQNEIGENIADSNQLEILITAPGSFQLLIADNQTGCTSLENTTVIEDTVIPLANAGPTSNLNCHQDTVLLFGAGSSLGQDFIMEWSSPDGNILSLSTHPTIAVNEPGSYILTVTDTSSNCFQTDMVVVEEILPPTQLEIDSRSPVCADNGEGSIEIVGVEGGRAPFYFSFEDQAFGTVQSWPNLNTGYYSIAVLDAENCIYSTEVTIKPTNPLYLTLGEIRHIKYGESIELQPVINKPKDEIIFLEWKGTHELSCVDCWNPTVRPTETAVYSLTLEDKNGCRETAHLNIVVSKPRDFFVPTVFSPNNDGKNDRFTIFSGTDVTLIRTLKIYNRWGSLVFEATDLSPSDESAGWDGTMNNFPTPVGTYIYIMEVEFADGVRESYKGDISLMR